MKENITFIIGAEASYEYGYPLGVGLYEKLIRLTKDKEKFKKILEGLQNHTLKILTENTLSDLTTWDDKYIFGGDFYQEWEEVSSDDGYEKGGILTPHQKDRTINLHLMLKEWKEECEKNKKLFSIDAFLNYKLEGHEVKKELEKLIISLIFCIIIRCYYRTKNIENGWIVYILPLLKNVSYNIEFIIFNYDILLERMLLIKEKEVYLEVKKNIHHVYGSIADEEGTYSSFNERNEKISTYRAVMAAAGMSKNLSTIRDGNHDDAEKYKNILANSSKVIFLGFGFDEMNSKILGLAGENPNIILRENIQKGRCELYVNSYKGDSEYKEAHERICNIFSHFLGSQDNINFSYKGAKDALKEFIDSWDISIY